MVAGDDEEVEVGPPPVPPAVVVGAFEGAGGSPGPTGGPGATGTGDEVVEAEPTTGSSSPGLVHAATRSAAASTAHAPRRVRGRRRCRRSTTEIMGRACRSSPAPLTWSRGNTYLIGTYALYGAISVGLVVYLARTLFRNGAVFLEDVFPGDTALSEAVNKLLVVGFYLLNLGYAFLILRSNPADDVVGAVELLIQKLGLLLVSLGALHFLNMYVLYRLRRRAEIAVLSPPVAPQVSLR